MLPRREANSSPSCNTEFKNAWNYTFIPPYDFVAQRQLYQLYERNLTNPFTLLKKKK
jgi:hypothetical protein